MQGAKAKGKAPPPELVKEGPSVDELNQRIAALEAEKKRAEELRSYMQLERASFPIIPFNRVVSVEVGLALHGHTLIACMPAACRCCHGCPGIPAGLHHSVMHGCRISPLPARRTAACWRDTHVGAGACSGR